MYDTWTDVLAALTDAELFDLVTPTDGYIDEMLEKMAWQEIELRALIREGEQNGTIDYDCNKPDCDNVRVGGDDVRGHRHPSKLH